MNKERFYQHIETCMKQNDVREAVLENHDNNRWWPDDVRDRRKRLIIGGLSSRISYNMIHT